MGHGCGADNMPGRPRFATTKSETIAEVDAHKGTRTGTWARGQQVRAQGGLTLCNHGRLGLPHTCWDLGRTAPLPIDASGRRCVILPIAESMVERPPRPPPSRWTLVDRVSDSMCQVESSHQASHSWPGCIAHRSVVLRRRREHRTCRADAGGNEEAGSSIERAGAGMVDNAMASQGTEEDSTTQAC